MSSDGKAHRGDHDKGASGHERRRRALRLAGVVDACHGSIHSSL